MDKWPDKLRKAFAPAMKPGWWLTWLGILAGCVIMASGFVFFINPYGIVPGGVYGASIVLHNLFPSVQVGTFGYAFDIPLLVLSVFLLGANIGARTLVVAMITPAIMNILSKLSYPTQEALERLDPSQLLGGMLDMSDHLMLTCIIGAVIIGIGNGLVVRHQASTGGSDIVGMILQKYFHIRFSNGILLVDATVVCFGLVVIGFGIGSAEVVEQPSVYLSLYSLISIFVISRVIAFVLNGAKDDKLLFIISEDKLEGLHDYIIHDLDRSGTYIKSRGLYSGEEKEMLFIVVSHKQVAGIKAKIKEIDPRAFVVVTDAYDTFGEGWKPLPSVDELRPE